MKRVPFRGIVCANPVGTPGSVERFLAPAYEQPKEKSVEYIVWNPASNLPPRVRHPDRATAIKVAGRMAHENPGQEFIVCKLVNVAKKPLPVDVTYTDLEREAGRGGVF